MMGKTHFTVGIAVALPIIAHTPVMIIPGALGIIGATFPDIDFMIGLKHRGFTHSLLALVIFTSIAFCFNKQFGFTFGCCYLSHLILDSFTKMGVPLFYPSKRYYGAKLIKTGGPYDYFTWLMAIYIISEIFKTF